MNQIIHTEGNRYAIRLKSGAYTPDDEDLDRWSESYPGIDVPGELRKMAAWCDANPTRRKTEKGVKRFIVNWLNKAKPLASTSTRSRTLHEDLTDISWST